MKKLIVPFLMIASLACTPQYELDLKAPWWERPNIEICDDSPVDAKRIISALEWWASISDEYQVGEIYTNSSCDYWVEPGFIRFTQAEEITLEELNAIAYARPTSLDSVLITDDPNAPDLLMFSCTAYLQSFNTKWTIRHEIGHCFGWKHVLDDKQGHTMSTPSGHRKQGLEDYRNLVWY
jgi:hypothetical protein